MRGEEPARTLPRETPVSDPPGADRLEPIVKLTDAPTPDEEHAIGSGLARFNEEQSGIRDSRPLAVVVHDPRTNQPVGGLHLCR